MKNKKNRKLHGSVLLTVVVVMSLLIVFLFGTLALATAANNRAHVNYSSSQTGVTSRMVAQSAVDAMDSSLAYRQVIGNIKSTSAPVSVPVTIGNAGSFNAGALGDVAPVEVSYAGKKKIYDTDKKQWVDRDMLKFTSKVTMGGVESQTSAYVLRLLDTDPPDQQGNGAALITAAGANFTCQTSVWGGGYIGIPNMKDGTVKPLYDYYHPSVKPFDVLPAYDGTTNTCTVLKNSGAVAETDFYINGNVYIENWSGFVFNDLGKGITIWGDLGMHNNVGGNLKYSVRDNIDFTNVKFNEIPYVYVDGKLHIPDKIQIGNTTKPFPLNFFCGSIDGGELNDFYAAANIYCMDAGATSKILPKNSTELYKWTTSVINKTTTSPNERYTSSINTKGNLEIQNLTVYGDIRVEGDCTIKAGEVKIGGNLIVGGTLTVAPGAKISFFDGSGTGVIGGVYNDGYTGAKGDPILKSNCSEIETYEHDGKVDQTKYQTIKNEEIHYLELDPNKWCNIDEYGNKTPMDYAGNPTWNKVIYTWRTDLTPDEISYILNRGTQVSADVDALDPSSQKYNDDAYKLWNDFYAEARGYIDESIPSFDEWHRPNGKETYRVKTYYKDPSDPTQGVIYSSEPIDAENSYYDPTTNSYLYDQEPYRTLPEYDSTEKKFYDSGNVTTDVKLWYQVNDKGEFVKFVSETDAFTTPSDNKSIAQFKSDYHTDQVYPKYAERKVLLGLEKLPDPNGMGELPESETKVITRLDELPDTLTDPYANVGIPSQYTAMSNELNSSTGKVFDLSDRDAAVALMDNKYVKSLNVNDENPCKIEVAAGWNELQASEKNNAALYINENCILQGNLDNSLVINPEGGNLFIIVRGLSVSAGKHIIVDDSKGGNVAFYIEDNSEIKFNGSAKFVTLEYLNLLKHYNGKVIQYTQDSAKIATDSSEPPIPYPNIAGDIIDGDYTWHKERVRPAIEIYGGKNSKLTISNMELLTANILSPDITVNIEACSRAGECYPSAIYYNGNDVYGSNASSQFIMGCINSNDVTIPNMLQVMYCDNGGGPPTPTIPGSGDFQYTVLYYDEY